MCVCCALVVSDGGDHALLSSELTAIIHGILLAGGKLCALYGATRIDCASFFPPKVQVLFIIVLQHVLFNHMRILDISDKATFLFQRE